MNELIQLWGGGNKRHKFLRLYAIFRDINLKLLIIINKKKFKKLSGKISFWVGCPLINIGMHLENWPSYGLFHDFNEEKSQAEVKI